MAPKRPLVFRTNALFRKVDSGFFTDAEGVQHKVEVLGEGQQFVAFGIHPDTRKPYRWSRWSRRATTCTPKTCRC